MLLTKKVERPRELKWYQAGAMLYGDWGTSKAYVLGIAFGLSGHASWFFLGLMSLLTSFVAVCYMIICRIYPDGGGVYSAVKHRSQLLAVIGALLLVADYVVTVSLSALDAFHYFHFAHPALWAIAAILMIGALNWVGPSTVGTIATWIALAASVAAGILFLFTVPHLGRVELASPPSDWGHNWSVFVGIVLALSGVEAIANMTGVMVEPVEKTSKQAIWPVLLEVSLLTFLLGIAMNAIPGLTGHTEDMLRALGDHYIGPWYGNLISLIFGFLLLSAANTAVGALASIQFVMSKDRELPPAFSRLNRFGMPELALIVATLVPILVLVVEHDLIGLAALYAIGVVGAITLNLASCATNSALSLKSHERLLLGGAALVLLFVEATICVQKHNALLFVGSILTAGLSLRFVSKKLLPLEVVEVPAVNVLTVSEAHELASLYRSSFLVSVRSMNRHLLQEAVLRAKALGEKAVYLNFVEQTPPSRELPMEVEPSSEAVKLLAAAQAEIERQGLTAIPIWQFGDNPGKMIARAAKELEVNTVMIGTTKRSALVNLLRGDVLRTLVSNLARNCHLLISN
ncbi:MAG TPA: universal stress protein [Verrucomicrobiae bacterium]|nr:universal stress protein [Verrucomicrobiae bacterium]